MWDNYVAILSLLDLERCRVGLPPFYYSVLPPKVTAAIRTYFPAVSLRCDEVPETLAEPFGDTFLPDEPAAAATSNVLTPPDICECEEETLTAIVVQCSCNADVGMDFSDGEHLINGKAELTDDLERCGCHFHHRIWLVPTRSQRTAKAPRFPGTSGGIDLNHKGDECGSRKVAAILGEGLQFSLSTPFINLGHREANC
ncbi:hypothetical protein M427DRAFT_55420 [Gonapodya prolifera JEL478]|uniref:Uncharacterized protein n=1 Tax=Gonapodya prolifera (strain JEL478) TaxID=1344416 RepID=A0A139AI24_GONPJ|nr:hypothetical protein M427DRAFT_55420 [Gonapodya prolifera JEL478]|eukprot:KXS16466.1 hypothetical protein M427DRAFT_55420 [Gonapodya prolifera JEL478]